MNQEKLTDGIDEDGIIEDMEIETYYCPLSYVADAGEYLRIGGDNGGTDVEIRVPVEMFEQNGWQRVTKAASLLGGLGEDAKP